MRWWTGCSAGRPPAPADDRGAPHRLRHPGGAPVHAGRPRWFPSRRPPGHSRPSAVHPGALRDDVPRPAVDDATVRRVRQRRGHQPALPVPARSGTDRPLRRLRPADSARLRLVAPHGPGRSRAGGGSRRHRRRHGGPLRRPAARRALGELHHQRDSPANPGVLPRGGGEAGRAVHGTVGNPPERSAQGVPGPQGVHLPAGRVDAAGGGHRRMVLRTPAPVQPYLGDRLPRPGKRDAMRCRSWA